MLDTTTLLTVSKTVTLLLGVLITSLAAKAYCRTDATALRSLAAGFALVTVGTLLGGVLRQAGARLALSQSVQSLCTAGGFAVLVHSLYAESSPIDLGRDLPPIVHLSAEED